MTASELRRRAFHRPISTWWWLEKRSYFVFMMRELSSVFVAWSVVFLLLLLYAVGRGDDEYRDFLDWAKSPWLVVVNGVSLLFLVLHTVTWFDLTPKAMVLRLGGRRLPAWLILASQYAGWFVVSAFVVWLVTR
jgi:succinate dehydrogenase subunit C